MNYNMEEIKKKIEQEIKVRNLDFNSVSYISELVKISFEFNPLVELSEDIKEFLLQKIDGNNTIFDAIINNLDDIARMKNVILSGMIKENQKEIVNSTDFPNNIFFMNIEKKATFLDLILEIPQVKHNGISQELMSDSRVVKILCAHQRVEDILNASPDVLLSPIDGEQTIIDFIIMMGNSRALIKLIENCKDVRIALKFIENYKVSRFIQKYFYIIFNNSEQILLSKINDDNTLFDVILDKISVNKIPDKLLHNKNVIEILIRHKRFDMLLDKNVLLYSVGVNTVIDMLLDDRDFLMSKEIEKVEALAKNDVTIAIKFLENDQPLYLIDVSDEVLQTKVNDSFMFDKIIDRIIAIVKNPNNINNVVNQTYSKKFLLHRTKSNYTFLEFLLSLDKDVILKRLIVNGLDEDLEILTILRLNQIDIGKMYKNTGNVSFSVSKSKKVQSNSYSEEFYKSYYSGNVSERQESLIERLKTVFIEDGKSDVEVINLVCNSFRYLFINNNKYVERDLESLINIKNSYPNFILKKGKESYFSFRECCIQVSNVYDIDSFNHELTHALHFFSMRYKVPIEYLNLKVIVNEEKLNNLVDEYKLEYRKIFDALSNDDIFDNSDVLLQMYQNRYNSIIKFSKQEQLYPDEVIEYVKQNFVVYDEYKKYYEFVNKRELCFEIMSCNFSYLERIIDIVNSLKNGDIYDGGIMLDDTFRLHLGHDSEYYQNPLITPFMEIIAEFGSIIKSQYRHKALQILEGIVGSELIDVLESFYDELVVEPMIKKGQK